MNDIKFKTTSTKESSFSLGAIFHDKTARFIFRGWWFFFEGGRLILGMEGGGGGWLLNGILSIALKLKQGSRQIFPSTGR